MKSKDHFTCLAIVILFFLYPEISIKAQENRNPEPLLQTIQGKVIDKYKFYQTYDRSTKMREFNKNQKWKGY